MKTKSLLSAIAVVVLSTSVGYAQRVEATLVDGHPVINCEKMPASAYTTISKGDTEAQLKAEEANKTVYKRFAVYKSDNSTTDPAPTWSEAFTICSGLGGGWRLPTQRELMLIWVLKKELGYCEGFTALSHIYNYWSSTEISKGQGWFVHLGNGDTGTINKTGNAMVRCIKELQR